MPVVVAGGGLIGLAVAWRAALGGLAVTVVDDAPGHRSLAGRRRDARAGHRGGVRRGGPARAGPRLAGALPVLRGRARGGLGADRRAAHGRHAARRLRRRRRGGPRGAARVPARARPGGRRGSRRARPGASSPGSSPRVRGALHVPGDHSVDPRAMHAALLVACRAGRRRGAGRPGGRGWSSRTAGRAGLRLADGAVLRGGDRRARARRRAAAGCPACPRAPSRCGRSRGRSCGCAARRSSRAPCARWSAAARSTSSRTAATGWSSAPPSRSSASTTG